MSDRGSLPVVIRFYEETNKESLERFKCAWRKREKQAQLLIRNAPIALAEGSGEILVAKYESSVVGAYFSAFYLGTMAVKYSHSAY
jgi:hypothetical protein